MLKHISGILTRRPLLASQTRRTIDQQRFHDDASELQLFTLTGSHGESQVHGETSFLSDLTRSNSTTSPRTGAEKFLGPRFAGWKFGVLNFAMWASLVFLINFIVTIWGSVAAHSDRGVFYEGDCERVKRINTGLHILINILSTILLSGSNYCMQAMSAPTASEVERAHAKRVWLDIGVPGLRNIKHISRRRKILWYCLGLSSLPLHLFYNSAVFASISTNDYVVASVSESFITDSECLNCATWSAYNWPLTFFQQRKVPNILAALWSKARTGDLDRLEPAECLNQYARIIQSDRLNLLLVAADHNFPSSEENKFMNNSHVYWLAPFEASLLEQVQFAADIYKWICSRIDYDHSTSSCSQEIDAIKRAPDRWRVGEQCLKDYKCMKADYPVEYCLSEKAVPRCRLHFEPRISIVITVLNFVKAMLMFYIVCYVIENPLMTMGDAVASFLETNDLTTRSMCLASMKDFKQHKDYIVGAIPWADEQYRWKDVTSKRRRSATLLMFLSALVIVASLLAWGLSTIADKSIISRVGYGAVDPRTAVVGLPNELILNALIANTPQLILSLLYFSYNGLFTAMLMGYEWTTYASKRKGLRITRQPVGAQRSSYFLQLPYRFGIPLMILSGIMHLLVSQSIFLIAIDYHNTFNFEGEGLGYKTLGFSPSAIISVIALGSLMIISIVAFGYVPYKCGLPLAGSCSLAISAACHGEENGATAAKGKLQWGVVSTSADGVGHCAFSTGEVETPVKGEMYT